MTQKWIPHVETRTDTVTLGAVKALHDLLDRKGRSPEIGDPLPILWHWLTFLPQTRQSDLGPDGHPLPGGFLPPTSGKRRMYAGGHVNVEGTPRVGDQLCRSSSITELSHKQGRTGDLMFVTVDHWIGSTKGAIQDRNNIVYRHSNSESERVLKSNKDIDHDVYWGRQVPIDPTLLFRFSALTYNAHRIHYDRDYAVKVENYPGLLVQGPLQAILLADAAAQAFPDRSISQFRFRSTAPAFDNHPLELRIPAPGDSKNIELQVYSGGRKTMSATATFKESV